MFRTKDINHSALKIGDIVTIFDPPRQNSVARITDINNLYFSSMLSIQPYLLSDNRIFHYKANTVRKLAEEELLLLMLEN